MSFVQIPIQLYGYFLSILISIENFYLTKNKWNFFKRIRRFVFLEFVETCHEYVHMNQIGHQIHVTLRTATTRFTWKTLVLSESQKQQFQVMNCGLVTNVTVSCCLIQICIMPRKQKLLYFWVYYLIIGHYPCFYDLFFVF